MEQSLRAFTPLAPFRGRASGKPLRQPPLHQLPKHPRRRRLYRQATWPLYARVARSCAPPPPPPERLPRATTDPVTCYAGPRFHAAIRLPEVCAEQGGRGRLPGRRDLDGTEANGATAAGQFDTITAWRAEGERGNQRRRGACSASPGPGCLHEAQRVPRLDGEIGAVEAEECVFIRLGPTQPLPIGYPNAGSQGAAGARRLVKS